MKIVHIHSGGEGGAGRACMAIHNALLQQGVDSKVLTYRAMGGNPSVYVARPSNLNKYIPPKNKIIRKIKNKLRNRGYGLLLTEVYDRAIWELEKKHPDVCFTSSYSSYDLAENPLVKEADIVHLHWVQNFLDFESFFKKMAEVNKPVVWTLHDLNPMMGGFHHARIKAQYYEEFKMVEDAMYLIKRKALVDYPNLSLVALSSQMKELISQHEFFTGKPIYTVFNCVDGKKFSMIDKNVTRSALGLETDKTIILFVSSMLNDVEKGFAECVKALDNEGFNNVMLVCVGDGVIPETKYYPIRHFNSVRGEIWLSLLYSAADYFVNSSFQESFGNTTVEAMLCGTPVVMTPVGIAKDIIVEENGVVCENCTAEALAKAIKTVMSRQYDSGKIREMAIDKVSPEKIGKDYIAVYEDVLKRSCATNKSTS